MRTHFRTGRLQSRATMLVLIAVALAGPSLAPSVAIAQPGASAAGAAAVQAAYEKREVRIPMRDGRHLFTSIYIPRDSTRSYGMLMTRTPYGVAPYGADQYRASLGPNPRYQAEGFIFVYQDARGRYYSEGDFTEMTPHIDVKKSKTDVDESTDSYDTVDWLVANVRNNNGRVGIVGGSYPGFYTTASCINAHPALKACSPQAPMTDIFMGDDVFHNGAFMLAQNFGFYQRFGRGPRTEPGPDPRYDFAMGTRDAYQFYLEQGPVAPAARRFMKAGSALHWELVMAHPNYDDFWKARDIRPHLKNVTPAMLVVGGFYDTEDLMGPFGTFGALTKLSPNNDNRLIMGPWAHGGWNRGDGTVLGNLQWQTKTGPFFRDSVEFPFFMHHLNGAAAPQLPKALVFRTGADSWDRLDAWPRKDLERKALYLQPGGKLAFTPPPTATAARAYDSYVSDPAKPVPLLDRIESQGAPRDFITADQRFASRRPDVLVYSTEPLTEDVTISGPLNPVLHVATSGTDADFIVKLIDVFPDDAPNWEGDSSGFIVGGYQQLVRGDPFRGRFRRSFTTPVAFTPDRPDSLSFTMSDVNHTFKRGHRIMVQVQSSWFPYVDRNPQTFVPNIFEAKPEDFKAATMRVYHVPRQASRIEVGVVPAGK